MNYSIGLLISLFFISISCGSPGIGPVKYVTNEDQINNNIATLKKKLVNGDLVVRMTDDLISEQIKFLNEKEKIYSHAGIVVIKKDQPVVCHIAPNEPGKDTIQFVSIDSFINPAKNLACALYRYNLSKAEQDALTETLLKFKADGTRFDRAYDLGTDGKMYCAELIDKALQKATLGKVAIKQTNIPERMQPMVLAFFKSEHATKKMVAQRKIITIDNLYLRNDCELIMNFPLKYFPNE